MLDGINCLPENGLSNFCTGHKKKTPGKKPGVSNDLQFPKKLES